MCAHVHTNTHTSHNTDMKREALTHRARGRRRWKRGKRDSDVRLCMATGRWRARWWHVAVELEMVDVHEGVGAATGLDNGGKWLVMEAVQMEGMCTGRQLVAIKEMEGMCWCARGGSWWQSKRWRRW